MTLQTSTVTILAVLVLELATIGICSGWLFANWWTRCYDDPPIGCFPTSYPYNNTGGIAPQDPDTVNVEFYLYNTALSRRLFSLREADQILTTIYNSSAKTVVIIHGYLENGFLPWIRDLGDELHRKDTHMNVFIVNWVGGSSNIIYYQSVANARVAGAVIALMLQKLIDLGGDKSAFHVIGFSLGAHVAGYVGSYLSGIGRITGLDPARPGFDGVPPETRLDATDGILVDVIHTDTDPVVGMGIFHPMGTVDFYPNGGLNQPGCAVSVMARVSAAMSTFDFSSESVKFAFVCSHLRAPRLFAASINHNCSYTTHRCHTVSQSPGEACSPCEQVVCPKMGFNIDLSANSSHLAGQYYTVTTSTSPYC